MFDSDKSLAVLDNLSRTLKYAHNELIDAKVCLAGQKAKFDAFERYRDPDDGVGGMGTPNPHKYEAMEIRAMKAQKNYNYWQDIHEYATKIFIKGE